MHDLRSENQRLQFEVEKIPGKEQEIQKLSNKVHELKLEIEKQRELQKAIVAQLEECKREAKEVTVMHESVATISLNIIEEIFYLP